ncbi:putative zinc finger cchc-type protein [Erysiphe necator]|uniref:Putative zinc finger cchc-type protein n=1 Tax=Uncinula necator TaxID=52586 RepID=A0A0B1P221_UNCNE|nr:putative zinc finger cchc-type protein [Erysiphe necator]
MTDKDADTNAGIALVKFSKILKGQDLPYRGYKRLLEEALHIIKELRKSKAKPLPSPKNNPKVENPTMAKILQEIQMLKSTITQSQTRPRALGQTWANVARRTEMTSTTIRITDEEEKRKIAQLSSEELVKKIGVKEVIGARQMTNGQVKVFFAGEETRQMMEKHKDWTQKLSSTAQIATPNYQVLVHDMSLSFDPENPEQIKELQNTNLLYIQGITIRKAAWLKKIRQPGQKTSSLIVWFDRAEQADIAIKKGIVWKFELKATEIFRSGFRLTQCFNCQKYGHVAKVCSAAPKCGSCAGEHNTRICPGKQDVRCINCARKHKAWDQICPVRIAAKAKTVMNRTQDSGRHTAPENQMSDPEGDWQIVGSRKRRAGMAGAQVVGIDGEVIARRGPGRPRKTPAPGIPATVLFEPNLATTANMLTQLTQNESRAVTRDIQAELNRAPECEKFP